MIEFRIARRGSLPTYLQIVVQTRRALENGIPIRVLVVERGSQGVDTAEDLERVEKILRSHRTEMA